jgi:hypothetical protein
MPFDQTLGDVRGNEKFGLDLSPLAMMNTLGFAIDCRAGYVECRATIGDGVQVGERLLTHKAGARRLEEICSEVYNYYFYLLLRTVS